MSGPGRSYYKDTFSKPSDYLHYWYSNSTADSELNRIIHQDAQALIGPQLAKFKAQSMAKKMLFASQGNSDKNVSELLNLFDITTYKPEVLRSVLEPNIDGGMDNIPNFSDLQEAISYATTVTQQMNTDQSKFESFKQGVTNIINALDPSQQSSAVIADIKKDLWDKYVAQAIQRGVLPAGQAIAQEQTLTGKEIIKDLLARTDDDKVFALDIGKRQINGVQVDKALKKILLLAQALETFQGGSLGMSGTYAVSHNKTGAANPATGDSEIIDILAGKVRGLTTHLKGAVAEIAATYGFLKAHIDNETAFEQLKIEPHSFGNNSFKIDCKFYENESFDRVLKEAKAAGIRVSRPTTQRSKGDIGYTINGNTVEGSAIFSVKSGNKINITGGSTADPSVSINIQKETPLATLMAREMGLSSSAYLAVIQLLVGHGSPAFSDSMLDAKWEVLKQKLLQLAFVSALTGLSIEGKALYMIAGNAIISMENIIEGMINSASSGLGLSMTQIKGSLNRSDYMAGNVWVTDGAPNQLSAETRSAIAWSNASTLLYNTKINIHLNATSLSKFQSL